MERKLNYSVMMKMTARNKAMPRGFSFKGIGKGDIIEEAAVDYGSWSSAIQLLKFENGDLWLRFCYYSGSGKLAPRALSLTEENIADLREEIAKKPQVKSLLQQLL